MSQLYISSKSYIEAKLPIFAGICTWRETTLEDKQIIGTELRGKIGYGELNIIKNIKEITKDDAEKELKEKYKCEVKII